MTDDRLARSGAFPVGQSRDPTIAVGWARVDQAANHLHKVSSSGLQYGPRAFGARCTFGMEMRTHGIGHVIVDGDGWRSDGHFADIGNRIRNWEEGSKRQSFVPAA